MKNLQAQYVNSRILLIDDDMTNNLLVENILRNHGYQGVRSITDPRLAPDVFKEYDPDLILLDYEMPNSNGFKTLRKLQTLNKKELLPVIMISVKNDHNSKNQALSLGATYFIDKPIDKTELLIKVQNTLRINRLHIQSTQKIDLLEKNLHVMENEFIESLLLSAKFRDQETGEHINRVSNLVYILSKGMGFTDEVSANFATASKLHDIGKIGIPDHILCKSGKLSEEEWMLMKNHTLIGESILSAHSSEIMKLSSVIARTHHENWDGSGYPLALSGNQINIAGRVTAVADVFDALLSDRPYKKTWDIEKAINYIQDESGKKFDPEIVSVFVKNMEEITALY